MKRVPLLAVLLAATVSVIGPATATAAVRPPAPASHGFGVKPPLRTGAPPAQRPRIARMPAPAAVDLTPWAVPVGNQGGLNSCVAWAIDYAMLGWYSRREGHAGAPFAPMYAYAQIQAMHGWRDGGAYVDDGMQIAEQQGVDTQSDYPQGSDNWWTLPTPAQHVNAAAHRTLGSAFLYASWAQPPGDAARAAIEAAVASGHPVALSIPVYAPFEQLSPGAHRLTAADVSSSPVLGYHELLIVGYDAAGARIQNSWGTSWGDRGFADLAWDFIDEYSLDASVMTGFADVGSPGPAVGSVAPTTGPLGGGTAVAIHGLDLAAADAVTFGTFPASSYTVVDDRTIVAIAPRAISAGPVHVHVHVRGSTESGATTTFTYLPPYVASLLPPVGAARGGSSLTLTGRSLQQVTAATVGGVPVTSLHAVDDTTLRIVTPAHAAGAARVMLQVGATSISAGTFRYVAGPTIRRLTRVSGHVIVIRGSALLSATKVSLGTHRARIIAITDHAIRVRVPLGSGAVRTRVQVRVTTPYGTSAVTARTRFRY